MPIIAKYSGHALIVVSFLCGAFLTSLDPTVVNWQAFAPVLLAGIVGLFMVKRGQSLAARDDKLLASNRAGMASALDNIIANLDKLNARRQDLPAHAARFEIDRDYREDLTRFVDARDSLAHIYGLQAYADIMSAFAAGERYLNRVWSASADGYVDEVRAYIERAYVQFQNARAELDKAQAKMDRSAIS